MAGLQLDRPEQRRRQWLTALAFVIAAALLLYLPRPAQASLGNALRTSILAPFVELNGALSRARARAADFDVLRAQMDSALALLAAQRTLAEENRQLRGLLELRGRDRSRLIAATVLRSGTAGAESAFTLDVGAVQGVVPFAPVLTEHGILGVVAEVRENHSLAIDWSHPEFRVSAMTADGESHGLVEAARGRFREQDRLILQGADFLSDIAPGAEVVTSGRGGVFPRGVLIGWAGEVAGTSSGWSKSYYVIPAVAPGAVSHALVELPRPVGGSAGEGGAPRPGGSGSSP
ncbi:MAG: rod shape-determining protein MreC [Gemmatimonadota bacterium]|nr:rod shape-determining protein MreC [Gemmatimonadota bacterium]